MTGVPGHLDDGSLVWVADDEGGRRLFVGDRVVTPPTLQVRDVLDIDRDTVLFRASGDPTEIQLWTWDGHSLMPVSTASGVYSGRLAGGVGVLTEQSLEREGVSATVVLPSGMTIPIPSLAERPGLDLRVHLGRSGTRDLSTAVVFPSWHEPGSRRLPVLLDPYGGPHAQRVLASQGMYLTSQWFAEQGFAVVVADGRGTPGRGPAFERAVLNDLATPVLDDQVDALQGVAQQYPDDLDLSKVAIRGWSFGGYLAALAVLRRPDVFHAAIAGAAGVTDWRSRDRPRERRRACAGRERGQVAAERPAADGDLGQVEVVGVLLGDPLQGVHLVVEHRGGQVVQHRPLEGGTASRGAAAVGDDDGEALLGEPLAGEVHALAGQDALGVRPAVRGREGRAACASRARATRGKTTAVDRSRVPERPRWTRRSRPGRSASEGIGIVMPLGRTTVAETPSRSSDCSVSTPTPPARRPE
ncbi:hypothetical protein GCM10020219_090390 [Nonomuraea dietziae]